MSADDAAEARAAMRRHLWAAFTVWAEAWRDIAGDPPPWFHPDDGPRDAATPLRRILWVADRCGLARGWLAELEALSAESGPERPAPAPPARPSTASPTRGRRRPPS